MNDASTAHDEPDEEPLKSYHTILEQEVVNATKELERPAAGLLLSALSAGLDLGFGPFLMGVALTLTKDTWPYAARELLIANAYAAGFIFVVLGRSQLFTEQTTSAVLPVLARRSGVEPLLRLWALVLIGNLVGATAIAAMIAVLGPALGIIEVGSLSQLAAKVLGHSWQVMVASAVAAGWLMGLVTWLVTAARDTTAQILVVWMTTFLIGIAGFHHSIAGTTEVLAALFAGGDVTFGAYSSFLASSVVGNILGGSCFVALLKFGHVVVSKNS